MINERLCTLRGIACKINIFVEKDTPLTWVAMEVVATYHDIMLTKSVCWVGLETSQSLFIDMLYIFSQQSITLIVSGYKTVGKAMC